MTSRLQSKLGLLLMVATVELAACASQTAPRVATSVRLDPAPAAQQSASAPADTTPLPALPPAAPIVSSQLSRPIDIDVQDQDIRSVVAQLASRYGVGYELSPDVRGRISAHLHSRSLDDALNEIVRGRGLTYAVEGGVLRIAAVKIETRIFSLDYVALSRVGTATTVVQRRLSGAGVAGGQFGQNTINSGAVSGQPGVFGAAGAGGADVVTSIAVADLWDEIRVALEGLVFGPASSEANAAQSRANQAGGANPGGMRATSAYSRVDSSGTRLIINPMAGTILVSALPSKLDEVATFLRTFESSVQRQVVIEAKIVEVTLDKTQQYGVDWSVVANKGNVGLSARSSTSPLPSSGNVQLTLANGSTQISAVLHALQSQGDVRVLSSPRVSALNNQRAIFDVTTDEVFFTVTRQPIVGPNGGVISFNTQIVPQQVSVGIVLDVLPQISSGNTLTMNIRPVVTSVSRVDSITLSDGTSASAPVIDRREADTMARMRAGETIVIGGLMQTKQTRTESGIPLLRSIPLLGRLFTTYSNVQQRAELVVFLTPTIVAGQPPTGP